MYFIVLATFVSSVIAAENIEFPINKGKCRTPNEENGYCVPLVTCVPLNATLIKLVLTDDDQALLRSSYCGREGEDVMVCCPSRGDAPVERTSFNEEEISRILPQPGFCGTGTVSKIIGGHNAKLGDFPWTVLLQHVDDRRRVFLCGGSLIDVRYVLTAAHCFYRNDDLTISNIRLGEHDLENDIDCEEDACADPPVDIPVERVIQHRDYVFGSKNRNRYHDIALIRMKRAAPISRWIKPICLPQSNYLRTASFSNASMDIVGWGRTETSPISTIKLRAKVNGVTLEDCSALYRKKNITLRDTQICAIGEDGADSCEGDSGGPLIGQQRMSSVPHYFLAGIVSFGPSPCGSQQYPGVYTKTGAYIDWIATQIKSNS